MRRVSDLNRARGIVRRHPWFVEARRELRRLKSKARRRSVVLS
jgi:hypothetical protein